MAKTIPMIKQFFAFLGSEFFKTKYAINPPTIPKMTVVRPKTIGSRYQALLLLLICG